MSTKRKTILIIGAGISSQVFMSNLDTDNYNVIVVDKKDEECFYESVDDVPFYFNKKIVDLNVKYIEINVEMRIYDGNEMYSSGNLELSEKYSQKILGRKCGNTIKFLEKKKKAYVISFDGKMGRKMLLNQLLMKNNKQCNYIFNRTVQRIKLNEKSVILSDGVKISYDYLISTMPLNFFMDIIDIKLCDLFYKPFYIYIIDGLETIEYKVIYCVDSDIKMNRIARLGSSIFIESPIDFDITSLTYKEQKFLDNFIDYSDIQKYNIKKNVVFPGKFEQLNDYDYNNITNFLRKNDVFLLGRMANWRFKLIEDIFDDSKKIVEEIINGTD